MKLSLNIPALYRVKRGQTLASIARTFRIPPCLLARENRLGGEVCEGQVLYLPKSGGNEYIVRGGESRTLLCGSPERFSRCNGTVALYPGQRVYL